MQTRSEWLWGYARPELEAQAVRFLQGHEPSQPAMLHKLWLHLQDGGQCLEESDFVSEPVLAGCIQALQNPASVSHWPAELRSGDHFSGFLARLLEWTELQEWMDTAPVGQEGEIEKQLPRARLYCQWLRARVDGNLPLRAWFLREKARLIGLEGGDPLPWLEQGLRQAGRLQQWSEVAQIRHFLQYSDSDGQAALSGRQKRELAPLLEAVPQLASASCVDELRQRLLTTLLQLVPMEAALWLEKEQDWQVKEWAPPHVAPRYSHRLVDTCFRTQELSWGQPEQLEASRSLLLSEVRCLIAVPLGKNGVLFAWQSDQQSWLNQDQIEALQFLARLGGQIQSNLTLSHKIAEDLQQARMLHGRWQRIFHDTPDLALAELDDAGRLVDWNVAFAGLFGDARVGTLASQLLPEPERNRDLQGLQELPQQGVRSRLVRLGTSEAPCWVQLSDWRVAEQSGSFRAVLDVSSHDVTHWFDYLEELRHRLASDLHDGPAQLAAALQLSQDTAQAGEVYASLRNRLDFLRSPWIDGRPPMDRMHDAFRHYLPTCQVEWKAESAGLSRSQQQFTQRALLGVIEELSQQGPPRRVEADSTWLSWSPATDMQLTETFQQLLDSGLEVLGGNWSCQPGLFRILFAEAQGQPEAQGKVRAQL
ncbi:hypothetical protein IV102_38135 [bacterium]|nr:hypothetical protein [bacterium]